MKTPKHNIIPNDWPLVERVINDLDISISEAESIVASRILILESEMSQAIDSLSSQASAHNALASEVAATGTHESRILVLESEMSAVQAHEPSYIAAYGALVHTQ